MPRPDRRAFADALKAARRELRLSQAAMGKRLGVTERTFSRWETGAAAPQTSAREAVLAAFADVSRPARAQLARSLGFHVPEPAPPRPDPAALRREIDDAVRLAAEELDVSAKRLRTAVEAVLGTVERLGLTPAEARQLIAAHRDRRGS